MDNYFQFGFQIVITFTTNPLQSEGLRVAQNAEIQLKLEKMQVSCVVEGWWFYNP